MRMRIRKERVFFALTLLRVVLAFLIAILIFYEKRRTAMLFFIATALISFIDGLIGRKLVKKSLFRSVLDFTADRLLVNAAAISLTITGLLPAWVMLVFLGKDVYTVIVAAVLFYRDYRREFTPTALGKIALFFQIIALVPAMMGQLDWVLVWIAVSMTLASLTELFFKPEFTLVRKRASFDDFKMLRLIKFADIFTLTNVVFGIISILFAIKGWYATASMMLVLAAVSDYFDGKIAKIMGQQNEFGKELDSLADTISFGVAPTIFGFMLIQAPLAVISFTIFLFCGILRLARFNIMDVKGSYQGMPITLNGIIIPMAYFLDLPIMYYSYLYLVLGVLMVSSIKVRKF